MKICFVSDVHNRWGKLHLPQADVLVIAGDMTMMGTEAELGKMDAYLSAMRDGGAFSEVVAIAGNHDWMFERDPERARALTPSIDHYLQDSGVEICGVKFWGSPWQPWFHDWAFNLERGAALAEKWALIPDDTDVLVTHGPPAGILDFVADGPPLGCDDLAERVRRVAPHIHAFGHIHDSYGEMELDGTTYMNVSICDESYRPVNEPRVKEIYACEVTLV